MFPKKLLEGILKRIECYEVFQCYRRTRMKILRMKKRAKFLIKCMQYSLIPNFFRFKVLNNEVFKDEAVTLFQRRLLKFEVNKTHKYLKDIEMEVEKHRLFVNLTCLCALYYPQ